MLEHTLPPNSLLAGSHEDSSPLRELPRWETTVRKFGNVPQHQSRHFNATNRLDCCVLTILSRAVPGISPPRINATVVP
eukprot:8619730-Pyramimonas_sp.AAC.1